MTRDHKFRSRRQMLASAGRLSIGGVIAPALASAALSSPANAVAVPYLSSAEEPAESTADKVVDALEGAYGRHRGQRRNHTKGVGARGSFIGNPEAAIYSRSALFSGEPLDVTEKSSSRMRSSTRCRATSWKRC